MGDQTGLLAPQAQMPRASAKNEALFRPWNCWLFIGGPSRRRCNTQIRLSNTIGLGVQRSNWCYAIDNRARIAVIRVNDGQPD